MAAVTAACPKCNSPLRPLPDGRQACDACRAAFSLPPAAIPAEAPIAARRRRGFPVWSAAAWGVCIVVAVACAIRMALARGQMESAVQQGGLAAEMCCYIIAAYVVARGIDAVSRHGP